MAQDKTIGFIGLGVMGEPICRNLVKKSGAGVIVFDLSQQALARLRDEGAVVAASVAEVVNKSDLVFLCLPSAKHARAVFEGDGILKNIRPGQVIVDLGTSSVNQTRDFARQLQARGASWADAPIARTRQAAQDGSLSVMVGATPELFASIEPLIRCFATDVTSCGGIGSGQVTKILNNMVLFQTVNALAEAVAVARRNGVDPALLLDTLSKGSADSFALRNHGMKAIVTGNFPERAFSTEYALKDLSYALELADDAGVKIRGAELIGKVLLGRGVFSGDRETYRSGLGGASVVIASEAKQSRNCNSGSSLDCFVAMLLAMTWRSGFLNTPASRPPRCWSARDRGFVRSCQASPPDPFARARKDTTGSPVPCAAA